jgi:hypothetical protein
MFNDQDAGDISGLEEVFRSQEFRRASGSAVDAPAGVGLSVRRGEGIFGARFGRRPVADPAVRTGDDAGWRRTPDAVGPPVAGADETEASEQSTPVPASGAGPALGRGHAEDPSATAWTRHSTRYWTIACVSALVALVAAGVTAGTGQLARSNVAAQGRHRAAGQGGGLNTSGSASTGLAAPGGLLATAAAAGSPGPSSVAGTDGGSGSGNAPGGRVTLIGPATFTGAPGSPPAPSGSAPSAGGGAAGSPPSGTNPAAPVTSTVGSTVSSAGSSVTTLASQIGTSLPAAASTTGAVSNVISTVDQAVSASTS